MVGPHLLLREARSGGPIAWHLALLLTTRSTASLEIFIGRATRLHLGRSTHRRGPAVSRYPSRRSRSLRSCWSFRSNSSFALASLRSRS